MSRRQRRYTIIVFVVALAFAVLPVLGRASGTFAVVPVLSGSMEPDMSRGDVAVVAPVSPERVAVGDVIVFTEPGGTARIIHRVTEITDDTIRLLSTKGDANFSPDPWQVPLVSRGDVDRRILTVPMIGHLYLWLQSTLLRNLLIAAGLMALGAFLGGVWADRAAADQKIGTNSAWSPGP